jgi:hypothetical protein
MPPLIDLTGRQIGRWTVLRRTYGTQVMWECRCSCGVEKTVFANSLLYGKSRSCGCLRDEVVRKPRMADKFRGLSRIRGSLRFRAKEIGVSCTLSNAMIDALSLRPCYYCGSEPVSKRLIQRTLKGLSCYIAVGGYNGIDRVDNSKGYTPENCVSCCWSCNNLKGNLTSSDFIDRATKIIAGLRRLGCQ